MKLLNLTGRYYAFFVVGIILLGGLISYEILKAQINKQFNDKLIREKEQLIYELETHESLRETYYLNVGDRIDLRPVSADQEIVPVLQDTLMYDPYARDELLFRELRFTATVDDQKYQISIYKSLLSTEELISSVGEIMLILLAGLLISLVVVNRFLSKKIWGPFYEILNVVRRFDVTKPFTMPNTLTTVDEFNELHQTMGDILIRIKNDYVNLKEFTDNASHEIQTPLAAIKSKCEILLQSGSLKEEEISEIKSIYDSALRLSKLNQSLTLLSKIENHQFAENRTLRIASYIEELLESFSDVIEMRGLTITKKFWSDPELIINDDLAYTLFTNLINNSIKHNLKNGFIEIRVTETEIWFLNSGPELKEDPERLFERFRKAGTSGSPGLGLALVKRICDLYQLNITYSCSEKVHKITIGL